MPGPPVAKIQSIDGWFINILDNSIDGTVGSTTTIYVDENDHSHSLEIRSMNKEDNDWAKKIAVLIVVVPYAIGFLLTFILLYIRRGIAKAKAGVI